MQYIRTYYTTYTLPYNSLRFILRVNHLQRISFEIYKVFGNKNIELMMPSKVADSAHSYPIANNTNLSRWYDQTLLQGFVMSDFNALNDKLQERGAT